MSIFQKLRWPYREDGVFAILSFIVFFVPLIFGIFTSEAFETVKFIVWLVFFGIALLLWFKRKYAGAKDEQGKKSLQINIPKNLAISLSVFLFFAFLSAIFAPDKWYSFFGFFYRFTNGFGFFLLWCLTLIVLCDVLDNGRLKFLLKILAFDAGLVALKAILESVGLTLYQGMDSAQPFLRGSPSFLGNANFSSMFMVCIIPFAALFWIQTKSFVFKICHSLNLFLILIALSILASRGAILGLGAGVVFVLILLLFFGKGLKKSALAFFLGFLILVVLAGGIVRVSRPDFVQSLFNQDNVTSRLEVWRESLQGALSHPVVGVGLGNFALFHERLARPNNMGVFDDPHNFWILLLTTGGIPLALSFLGLVIWTFILGFDLWRRTKDYQVLAILGSMMIFVVSASFTPVVIPCLLLFAVLLAGIFTMRVRRDPACYFDFKASFLFAVIGILFICWGAVLLIGETSLHYGDNYYQAGDYARAYGWFKFSSLVEKPNQLSLSNQVQCEIQNGERPEVILNDITELKSIHPQISNTYVMAADGHFQMFLKFKNKDYLQDAIFDMHQALTIDPSYPERYGQLGFYYYLEGDFNSALENLNKSLSFEPNLLPSLVLETAIYQIKQDWPNMLSALERAYQSHPDDSRLRILRYMSKHTKDLSKLPLNIYYSPR